MSALPGAVASLAATVSSDGELRTCSAGYLCVFGVVCFDGGPKLAPDARTAFSACWVRAFRSQTQSIAKVLTADSFALVPRFHSKNSKYCDPIETAAQDILLR